MKSICALSVCSTSSIAYLAYVCSPEPPLGSLQSFFQIATTLRCGLRIPRGPSCGTSAENRALIVCCCNPTQWHRAQIKGCWAECALCTHTHKAYALQRACRARQASASLWFELSQKVKITCSTLCTSIPVLLTPVCCSNGHKITYYSCKPWAW